MKNQSLRVSLIKKNLLKSIYDLVEIGTEIDFINLFGNKISILADTLEIDGDMPLSIYQGLEFNVSSKSLSYPTNQISFELFAFDLKAGEKFVSWITKNKKEMIVLIKDLTTDSYWICNGSLISISKNRQGQSLYDNYDIILTRLSPFYSLEFRKSSFDLLDPDDLEAYDYTYDFKYNDYNITEEDNQYNFEYESTSENPPYLIFSIFGITQNMRITLTNDDGSIQIVDFKGYSTGEEEKIILNFVPASYKMENLTEEENIFPYHNNQYNYILVPTTSKFRIQMSGITSYLIEFIKTSDYMGVNNND